MNGSALVLNQTYEPLCVVSVRRATILILSAKAVCVADGDGILHSARQSLPLPSVVRLTRYVRVPYRTQSACPAARSSLATAGAVPTAHGPAETIDHVMPRSRGGRHAWENVVAACARCNHKKGDRTPSRARLAAACRAGRAARARRGGCWGTVRPTRAGRTGWTCPPPRSRRPPAIRIGTQPRTSSDAYTTTLSA